MQRKIRRMRMDQPRKTEILHDQCVRTRFIQEFRVGERRVQLAVAREDIERDIGFDVPRAAVRNCVRHLVSRKALRIPARIECAEAHIHRARARLNSRAHALGRPRRGKQFYLAHL